MGLPGKIRFRVLGAGTEWSRCVCGSDGVLKREENSV